MSKISASINNNNNINNKVGMTINGATEAEEDIQQACKAT